MQAILGIIVFIGLTWAISKQRSAVNWRVVLTGLALQFLIAFVLLGIPFFADALFALNAVVRAIEAATLAGASFVFGYLGGGGIPFEPTDPSGLYIFAFRVLPQTIVFSVVVAILWYWRVLPLVVRGVGWALQRTLGVGGAVGTGAAASVFLGMIETPLVIRAYLARLTRAEFLTVMNCGMATVSGSIMVLYAAVLGETIDGALGHLITASVINVIGAVYIARIVMPEEGNATGTLETSGLSYTSTMDAITRGTLDGIQLAVNVGAMVLVLVSLVALIDYMLGGFNVLGAPLSLERMTAPLFAPVAWLIGIPWAEAQSAGGLLASKLILNEVVAYLNLAGLEPGTLSDRSTLVMVYALCGFTNFGSLGILIAGLATLVPERREEIMSIAPMTLVTGTLTAAVTGAIVALVTTAVG